MRFWRLTFDYKKCGMFWGIGTGYFKELVPLQSVSFRPAGSGICVCLYKGNCSGVSRCCYLRPSLKWHESEKLTILQGSHDLSLRGMSIIFTLPCKSFWSLVAAYQGTTSHLHTKVLDDWVLTVQFSSVQGDICALGKAHNMRSAPFLRNSASVALEIVPMFVWLTMCLSRPFSDDHRLLPFWMPLSWSRLVLWWQGWLFTCRALLSSLSTSNLPRVRPCPMLAVPASLSALSLPLTPECPGQYIQVIFPSLTTWA